MNQTSTNQSYSASADEQCGLWRQGEFVNNQKQGGHENFSVREGCNRLILAVEDGHNITVYSLEELGRLIPRYREQFKKRFLMGKAKENKLLEFVRKCDMKKEEQTRKIIRNEEMDAAVSKLAQLFYKRRNDEEIIFLDKSYGSVEEIFEQMDELSADTDFVKVLRVEYENLCNDAAQAEMKKLLHLAGEDEDFLYHLIRCVLGKNKKYVGNGYELHTIEELQDFIVRRGEDIFKEDSQRRLLAWLYSNGFSEQITVYMEMMKRE